MNTFLFIVLFHGSEIKKEYFDFHRINKIIKNKIIRWILMDQDLKNAIRDIGDDIYNGLYFFSNEITHSLAKTLATTNILLGIIAISLVCLTIIKIFELKKK